MRGRKLAKLVFLSLLALVSVGCSKDKKDQEKYEEKYEEKDTEANDIMRECSLTEENVKLLGRTYLHQEVLWLAYSATGVEFKFNGTECSIDFVGDNMATGIGEDIHRAKVGIYVNEELLLTEYIDAAKKSIDVFKSDVAKDVTVRIVKLSETTDSTVGIESVRVVGTSIKKTQEKDLKIEFIGDSITCGYGVEAGLESTYSTKNENATKAYAYQTAKALNADYSLVSISGYGIISGWTDTGVKNEESLILPYYEKIGRSYGRIAAQISPETIPWDFTKFVPDVIVINLGTNDASYCGSDVSRCKEYEAGYKDFIKAVRGLNPNAKIICSLGIMGDSLYPYLENAVSDYKSESKDDNILTLKFDVQLEADGYGVDYHPSQVTHTKAALKLANFIKAELALDVNVEETLKLEDALVDDIDTSWIDPSKKLVALTFDDGPVDWKEDSTAMQILKTLKQYGQHATFFYNGMNINPINKQEILFAKELGCEIANHTWSHLDMTSLSQEKMKKEVDDTSAVLSNITGQSSFLFRLPYLTFNETVLETVDAPCIGCCVDTRDYSSEATKESIINSILEAHEKGTLANSILLLHEPYEKTKEAVAEIVPKLLKEGYQLVTVSELAKMNGISLKPGVIYSKLEKN